MPAGSSVRPGKWTHVIDLYDDGSYSAIWGIYDGNNKKRLGTRWNGGSTGNGYPNLAGHPLWFVEPEFLSKNILLSLLYKVNCNSKIGNINNIILALK